MFVDGIICPRLSTQSHGQWHAADRLVTWPALTHGTAAGNTSRISGNMRSFAVNLFAALNTAFLHDGALVVAPRKAAIEPPVHLLFIATQAEAANHPRCLLIAEPGSAVTFVEDYITLQEGDYVTNAVTEIALADNAEVNHIRVQRDSIQAFHIANCAVSLGASSRYQSVSVALGGRISRYDLNVLACGGGSRVHVDGLALITDASLPIPIPALIMRSRTAQAASYINALSTAPRTPCSTARSWCVQGRSALIHRNRAATCC